MPSTSTAQSASSCLQHPTEKIDSSKLRPPAHAKPGTPFDSCRSAASYWFSFGFKVIPIAPGTKKTAVTWDSWLDKLSDEKISNHWSKNPTHEIGFIVGDDTIVLDADSPEATVSLAMLEQSFDVVPNMTVKTRKGTHHYFKLAAGVFATTDSHSTQEYPERIDVKTGRTMVILPPSTGKSLDIDEAENAASLTEVNQAFVDAVFRHNGRPAPRPYEKASSPCKGPDTAGTEITILKALLDHIEPDSGSYDDWLHCGMAIFHETGGSAEGLDLFDTWSSKGASYKGRREIEGKWRSFKADVVHSVTIGTLIKLVKDNGGDWQTICADARPQFDLCETEIIDSETRPVDLPAKANPPQNTVETTEIINTTEHSPSIRSNPFDQFSLRGMSDELEKNVVSSVPLLGEMALLGQATVFYGAPNTGKTVIVLSLLIDAIKNDRVNPTDVYYLNMDDTGQGLVEKLRLAEEYNFHMLAEGHRDFTASEFLKIVRGLIKEDQASGVVIVLDTLKKFVNLMSKDSASDFTNTIRAFVLKGGTLIALAHTNKNPGSDGMPVYGGVSDIPNDIDCGYIISTVSKQGGNKVVKFVNIKKRGYAAEGAAYTYCIENGISYNEILASVQPVDESTLEPFKQAEAIRTDAEVINAVSACINDGMHTKMKLAEATADRAGISKRAAIKIIEKYTGNDPSKHKWSFSVRARGAKAYVLLEPPQSVQSVQTAEA